MKQSFNGDRSPVSYEVWCKDSVNPSYCEVLAHPLMLVYKVMEIGPAQTNYRYGGRRQGGSWRIWNGC